MRNLVTLCVCLVAHHALAQAPLATQKVMAFVAVKDLKAAKTFYGGTLKLRLKSEEPIALMFESNGNVIRIQLSSTHRPEPYTVLGWQVKDIAASIRSMSKDGVKFEKFPGFTQDTNGVWTAPDGTKVAWFKDPEGNILSVTQFPVRR